MTLEGRHMNFSPNDRAYRRDADPTPAQEAGLTQHCGVNAPRLKIFFITEDDPIYVIEFFKVFLAEYSPADFEICGMTIDQAFHENIGRTLRRMTRFYGAWGVVRQGLRFLRARILGDTVKALAQSKRLPMVPAASVNDAEFLRRLKTKQLDLIVSVAAPEIFAADLLTLPRLGCINIHSGKLPNYRGMMPTFWQMLRGENAITISVHKMAQKLDAGDILATQSFPLRNTDSLDRVIKATKREGARLLLRVLRDLRKEQARPVPIDLAQSAYFSFPKPSDVREFRKRGHRLI